MARRDKFEALHARNRIKYEKEIKAIFREVCRECGMSVNQLEYIVKNAGENADFARIPAVRKVLDKLQRKLAERLEKTVVDGVKAEWKLANDKYDALVGTMAAGDLLERMSEAQRARTFARNMEALEAFLQRKEEGLGLSQRVWQYSGQMRDAMEVALELGISEGQSAAEIARELQQYLVYPDKLFRRVRDEETGELKLSKPASLFHPGQGVYRSSYKNALRLALNETNIAYRKSDSIRRQGLSFVVGIEVHLSNNHNCKGVPEGEFFDICDLLQGKYPPDFEFVGWHPNCRCWTSTIQQTDEEFFRDSDGVYRGSVNEVKDVPPQFKKWLEENQERIDRAEAAGKLPYFLRDNQWAWKEDAERPNERKVNQTRIKAEERHAARTEEQVKAIKDRWEQRKRAQRNAERTLRLVDSVPGMREYLGDRVPTSLNIVIGEKPYDGDYKKLEAAARIVRGEMRHLRNGLDVLDNPWEALKAHGIEKTLEAESSIRKKLSQWESQPLDYQLKKLKFEAQWLEDNKKGVISTWEVARDAYLKAAREVEWKIEWEPLQNELKAIAKNPYADKDMVAEVRSYIGKDKDEAEYALSHLKIDTERNELEAKWQELYNEAPQLFTPEFVKDITEALEEVFDEQSLDDLRITYKAAVAIINRYRVLKEAAEQYLSTLKYESVKDELRSALTGTIDKLISATELASRAEMFAQQADRANEILKQRPLLEKLNPEVIAKLEERIKPKKFSNSEIVSLNLAINQAKATIDNWNNEVDTFNLEYASYATGSNDYKKLVKEAQKAISNIDLKALRGIRLMLADKKAQLEKEKAYWAGVEAEWSKMYGDVAAVQTAINESDELDRKAIASGVKNLIADFDANYSGPRKLREARKAYKAILEKAKELGIEFNKIGQLDKDTIDALLHKYEVDETERSKDKELRPDSEKQWALLTPEEKNVITKYTYTFSYLNEPLRGQSYLGARSQKEFEKDCPLLTEALEKCGTKTDMVVRRGTNNYYIPELGKDLRDIEVGDEFTEPGFLSTSVHRNCGFFRSYNLIIIVPKGVPGFYAEPCSHYNKGDQNGHDYMYDEDISKANLWDGVYEARLGDEEEWIGGRGLRFRVYAKSGSTITLVVIGVDKDYAPNGSPYHKR